MRYTVRPALCAWEFRRISNRTPPNRLNFECRDPFVAVTKQQSPLEGAKRQSSSRPCYLHLSAHKLRVLVKSKKALNPEQVEALDEAWFHTFGVLLILQDCESVEARPPGDSILGVEQVLRMTNLSLTSLKRHVLYGSFPKPHRSSPNRIGWRPSYVTAWLHEVDNSSRRSHHGAPSRALNARRLPRPF